MGWGGRGNLRENREDPAPTVGVACRIAPKYRPFLPHRHAHTMHPACRPPMGDLRFLQRRVVILPFAIPVDPPMGANDGRCGIPRTDLPANADCRGGVFATRRFPRPIPPHVCFLPSSNGRPSSPLIATRRTASLPSHSPFPIYAHLGANGGRCRVVIPSPTRLAHMPIPLIHQRNGCAPSGAPIS